MVIKIKIHNEIVWPLVVLLLMKYFGMQGELVLFMALIWLIYLSIRDNRMILSIPSIYGFKLFLGFIVTGSFVGMVFNQTRDVAKDIYYIIPSIIVMMIGYLYCKYDNEKSVTKTLYLTGTVISILSFIELLMSISIINDVGIIRSIMGEQVYEIIMIFAIMFAEKIIGKKVIFSVKTDWIILLILALKCVTSLGRTELIDTLIMVLCVLLLNLYVSGYKLKAIVNMMVIFLLIVILGYAIYNIMPDDARDQFMEKLVYSFEEVDSSIEYKSTEDAMQHWRAYEIECAKKQWKDYNVVNQLIGEGLGKYIHIGYIPHNFTDDMVKNNAIALLHNSYYSLLVKGGIIGVVSIIWLYLSNIIAVFRKEKNQCKYELCALSAITIGMAVLTYVVRGIYSQSMLIVWPLMVGWINAKIRKEDNR